MSLTDVCRLCLTKDDLVWIFDKRFESSDNMKNIIYITTGVEISIRDIISQKICKKCCELTIKMFEFRRTSLINDRKLREDCRQYLKEKDIKIPNTEVTIRRKIKINIKDETHKAKKDQNQKCDKTLFTVHPSVQNLFKIYPQIKLPTICLKSHMAPFVSLKLNKVEDYFKEHHFNMNEHIQLMLEGSREPAKETPITSTIKTSCSKFDSNQLLSNKNENLIHLDKQLTDPVKISQNKYSNQVQDKQNLGVRDNLSHDIQSKQHHKISNEASDKNIDKPVIEGNSGTGISLQSNKRKFSEIDSNSEIQNKKKLASSESLELMQEINTSLSATPTEIQAYTQNAAVSLYICNICSSVHHSTEDLTEHQYLHLRCPFCKIILQTREIRNLHIEKMCVVKNTSSILPDVDVVRIEYNAEVRSKYPEAFDDFIPSLTNVCKNLKEDKTYDHTKILSKHPHQDDSNAPKPSTSTNVEVIEIMSDSDDDESLKATAGDNNSSTNNSLIEDTITKAPVSNFDKSQINSCKDAATSTASVGRLRVLTASKDNTVFKSVSILKPNIKIRNNCILDGLDPKLSDLKALKELLGKKCLRLSAESNVQTDLPSDESIFTNKADALGELHKLKPQLYVYKIPVVIKNGPLSLSYNYHPKAKQQGKLCLWNDLTPIDIKVNSITVSNSCKRSQSVEKCSTFQQTNNFSSPIQEQKIDCENSNSQITKSCSTIVTSTYTFPIYSLPSQTMASSKRVDINQKVRDSTSNDNNVDKTILLNNYLQTPISSPSVVQTANSDVSSTSIDKLVTNNISVGTIRVKNVWELT